MIRSMTRIIGAITILGLLAAPALAQTTPTDANAHSHSDGDGMEMPMGDTIIHGDLQLFGAFTRAMPPAAVAGGGFITIKNTGHHDERLVSATSPVSDHVETHIMNMENDVMKMQSQPEGFVIPAGGMLELKPGGKHLMFIGVETPFVEGENVMVELVFEQAGPIQVMLHAIPIGASGMAHGQMDHSSMDHSSMEGSSN